MALVPLGPRGELGGVPHRQKDNLHFLQAEVFDGLNEIFDHVLPKPKEFRAAVSV